MVFHCLSLDRSPDLPLVSVVIPVKNDVVRIGKCLSGILSQTHSVLEIVIFDSGSNDGTINIIRQYPKIKLIEIPENDFNHGETRNKAVEKTSGEFVICTVQDARPADENWISRLLRGFVNDDVKGVCGAQIVPTEKDTNPLEWFNPTSLPHLKIFDFPAKNQFDELKPQHKLEACRWDNVTAAYRREYLIEHPFPVANYGEDMLWAYDTLRSSKCLAYQPEARVFHYHSMTHENIQKRTIIISYLQFSLFGIKPKSENFLKDLLLVFIRLSKNRRLSWKERFFWIVYNTKQSFSAYLSLRQCVKQLESSPENFLQLYEKCSETPPTPIK